MASHIIHLARTIATEAHHGVFRADGTPYITHPEAVATYAAVHLGADDYTVATCWLHDAVEDTDLTLDALVMLGIPSPIICAIDAVTIRAGERPLDAVARAAENEMGKVVKLADNWHNSSTLDVFAPAVRRRRNAKYSQARNVLAAAA